MATVTASPLSKHALDRDALLLDAGNTLVFLDPEAAALVLDRRVDGDALGRAMAPAHRRYAERIQAGGSHEQAWRVFMACWVEAAGMPKHQVEPAVDALRDEHDRFNLWRRLPPEVPPALERARRAGIRLGIISNSEGQLLRLLERLDLAAPFEVILDSGVVGLRKPDPALFHLAAERLELAPEDCLYAGDIPEVDVVGAIDAGLSAALVDSLGLHPGYADAPRFDNVAALVDAMCQVRQDA
jgi:HAD superfamily hydrolase (TIGR01549 family)